MKSTTPTAPPQLVSMRGLARQLGVSEFKIRSLHKERVITPEIHEGRLIRFDAEAVRKTLLRRAAKQAKRPAAKLPPGMVPVI